MAVRAEAGSAAYFSRNGACASRSCWASMRRMLRAALASRLPREPLLGSRAHRRPSPPPVARQVVGDAQVIPAPPVVGIGLDLSAPDLEVLVSRRTIDPAGWQPRHLGLWL